MNIDITKTYTTRSGLPVRIYAVDGVGKYPVHGALFDGAWIQHTWTVEGSWAETTHSHSLVPAKTWRSWRKNDAKPKFIITKDKSKLRLEAHCFFQSDCDAELQNLFDHYSWIHEDGSETPCGVLEQ